MKKLIVISILMVLTSRLWSATPYVHSTSRISAIFSNRVINFSVFGEIKKIEFITRNKDEDSTYLIQTDQCKFIVTVVNDGDEFVPKWKTLDPDTSGCGIPK